MFLRAREEDGTRQVYPTVFLMIYEEVQIWTHGCSCLFSYGSHLASINCNYCRECLSETYPSTHHPSIPQLVGTKYIRSRARSSQLGKGARRRKTSECRVKQTTPCGSKQHFLSPTSLAYIHGARSKNKVERRCRSSEHDEHDSWRYSIGSVRVIPSSLFFTYPEFRPPIARKIRFPSHPSMQSRPYLVPEA